MRCARNWASRAPIRCAIRSNFRRWWTPAWRWHNVNRKHTMTAGLNFAPAFDTAEVDAIVGRFMRTFQTPGAAVAMVGPNGQAYVRGYGVRALGRPEAVDVQTSFAIASNSKAFLSACLAMLVDDGKLSWEDPVRRHLPEFALRDPAASAMMTVRDLLLHNSGLPLGAGDLMQFPRSDHSREEILRALLHFQTG